MYIRRIFLMLTGMALMLIFGSGCGTVAGISVTSEANPDFNVDGYTRYFINAGNDALCYKPVAQVLMDQGIIPYNGKVKASKLEVYMSDEEGICFPPRWNTDSLLWLRFTFPKKATVVFKDAETKRMLLKIEYQRAFFAVNAGYRECRSMIKDELEREIAKLKKSYLPIPLKGDTGSYSGD